MIDQWLNRFEQAWKDKDVEKVVKLFTEDVDYFETPLQKIEADQLEKEWETVKQQEDIELSTEVFSEASNRYTVQWSLSYRENGEKKELDGIYLIVLDDRGLCKEFWQYCQIE